jgi:alpha-galactosidase
MADRRDFLKTAVAVAMSTMPSTAVSGQSVSGTGASDSSIDLLRTPDRVVARFGSGNVVKLQYSSLAWTCQGVRVSAQPVQSGSHIELPIRLRNEGTDLTYLHLRWNGRLREGLLSIGDAWERGYGDLQWLGTVPERVMPWYFLTFDGDRVAGYGVKTRPSAFCFWQRDSDGITLSIDLRNGGGTTNLGQRELHACTVVTRPGSKGETVFRAGQAFCRLMSPDPRLPAAPLFGSNDWNYAYGKNTASGILRDADLIASLAPSGSVRPHIVIDDGWQDLDRFPSMSDLTAQIRSRDLHPGLWIRPLRPDKEVNAAWLLPDHRFGKGSPHNTLAFDPTLPEALNEAMKSVRQAVGLGYTFIKHDFSTYELFGRWGSEMRGQVTSAGWHFHDKSRTNAEIVHDLYQGIRAAAGEETTILGCNTVGHIAAGIFESQRVGDDTSGHDWERTRRYGVNTLSHRIAQHRTFSHIDPDIVAATLAVDWKKTSQWMDVVARSGTSLFFSPDPAALTPEVKSAMRDAMAVSAQVGLGFPVHPSSGTTPEVWQFTNPNRVEKKYDWIGPEGVSFSDV